MIRKFSALACVVLLIVMQSCSSQKNAASTSSGSPATGTPACTDQLIGKIPPLEWFKEDKALLRKPDQGMPAAYELYSISNSSLHKFFEGKDDSRVTNIPLPEPLGCQVFELINSGTMSPELKAKYPGLVSLKGFCISNRAAEVRMDFSAGEMNAQVSWGGDSYVVKPVKSGGRTFYMVYDRKYTTDKKQSFEGPSRQMEMKRYDR